ncbi:MAG: tRNA (adenosine(37)-N6)-threonylcarbamoyltransferase complex ATPase subunit type 1 TsaE [Acidimicrobiaceae bacterium]|nr:tRNA (adenosine(37)-N6)-threonylcarbamoyltransferase complex ATPase subunit type 1 TsaE [Acidimicrobiaceae bacterium]
MTQTVSASSVVCWTSAVEQTRLLAGAVARLVDDGDLLLLVGDLSAGKTAFTQGFAAALGVSAPVTSPTFTLANRYEGRLIVNHLDVYRLEDLVEARDLAIPELLEQGVTLIEWGQMILPALPTERLDVSITFGDGDDDRCIELNAVGDNWVSRVRALRAATQNWAGKQRVAR